MLRVRRVSIAGFRGFTSEQSLAFDRPVTLLVGGNHQGKSSTVNAIEWCLFGDACVGATTGIRERVGWEVPNRRMSGDVRVKIELVGPGPEGEGAYGVSRSIHRVGKKRIATVKVSRPGGSTLEGVKAEQYVSSVLCRSSFQSFMTTVYQHQEVVRSFLIQEPRDKNDAIDRLLGLSDYREILAGIKAASIDKTAKKIESEVEHLNELIGQLIRIGNTEIREKRLDAQSKGVEQADITSQGILRRAAVLKGEMENLAKDFGGEAFLPWVPQSWKDVAGFVKDARSELDRLWEQWPVGKEQQALVSRRHQLDFAKGRYEVSRATYQTAERRLQEFLDEHGDEALLHERIRGLSDDMARIDQELRELNARAVLLEEGIRYLEGIAPESGRSRCPLCNSDAPALLSHLEEEWQRQVKDQAEALGERRQQIQRLRTEAENKLRKVSQLRDDLKEADKAVCEVIADTSGLLERLIDGDEDSAAVLSGAIKEIERALELIGERVRQRRGQLAGFSANLEILSLILAILVLEEKKAIAERVQDTDRYRRVVAIQKQVAAYEADVRQVRELVGQCLQEEALGKLGQAGGPISTFFQQMTQHPDVTEVRLEPDRDPRSGGNDYKFRDQDDRDLAPVLSQGDLNCLALSIFLGLAQAAGEGHRLGFLILDDPTQSLGASSKRQLASVLGDVSADKQLIISTMDHGFYDSLVNTVSRAKRIYFFDGWDPHRGPSITIKG